MEDIESESPSGRQPLILEVKGNSLDDGPGIRTVIFFKGCPLSCTWCHNPESKRAGAELSHDIRECVACGTCAETCQAGAIDPGGAKFIDRSRCDLCFECVETCPSGALSRVGKSIAVAGLARIVEKDLPFFRTSGGGVTLSGGEPTMFIDYCSQLLQALKEMDVHTIIETCGYFNFDEFNRLVVPFTDSVFFDLKILDAGLHRELCGVDNAGILSNFERLYAEYLAGGTEILPRIPLIPGITATDDNLQALAGFLRSNGVRKVALLQYNPLWLEKAAKIGHESPAILPSRWLPGDELQRCREHFKGLEVV